MRSLQLLIYAALAYLALKVLLRWLFRLGTKRVEPASGSGEMVLDPQCRAYVLKKTAVSRRLRGETVFFCGTDCATAYERRG